MPKIGGAKRRVCPKQAEARSLAGPTPNTLGPSQGAVGRRQSPDVRYFIDMDLQYIMYCYVGYTEFMRVYVGTDLCEWSRMIPCWWRFIVLVVLVMPTPRWSMSLIVVVSTSWSRLSFVFLILYIGAVLYTSLVVVSEGYPGQSPFLLL